MSKKVALYGALAGLAVFMGYLELLVPLPIGIPGVKLGLSNVVVLFGLYDLGAGGAFFIMLVKVLCAGLLFSGAVGVWYSLAGGVLSFAVMVLLWRTGRFSPIGVSAAGGVFHNIGQVAAACVFLGSASALYYLVVLIPAGLATGLITGAVAKKCLALLQKK